MGRATCASPPSTAPACASCSARSTARMPRPPRNTAPAKSTKAIEVAYETNPPPCRSRQRAEVAVRPSGRPQPADLRGPRHAPEEPARDLTSATWRTSSASASSWSARRCASSSRNSANPVRRQEERADRAPGGEEAAPDPARQGQVSGVIATPTRSSTALGILAGGQARRLGGLDKAMARYRGQTLIARTLAAAGKGFAQVMASYNGTNAGALSDQVRRGARPAARLPRSPRWHRGAARDGCAATGC